MSDHVTSLGRHETRPDQIRSTEFDLRDETDMRPQPHQTRATDRQRNCVHSEKTSNLRSGLIPFGRNDQTKFEVLGFCFLAALDAFLVACIANVDRSARLSPQRRPACDERGTNVG